MVTMTQNNSEQLLSFVHLYTTTSSDSPEPQAAYLKWAQRIRGDTRHNPPGWRRCSVEDFSMIFFRQRPQAMNFEVVGQENRTLFYYRDGTGLALAQIATDKINVYRFGCQHDFVKVEKVGKLAWRYKCKNCGFLHVGDSSD